MSGAKVVPILTFFCHLQRKFARLIVSWPIAILHSSFWSSLKKTASIYLRFHKTKDKKSFSLCLHRILSYRISSCNLWFCFSFFNTFFQKVLQFEIWLHLDIFSPSFLFQNCNLGYENVNFENNDILFYLFFDLNHQRTSQDWYRVIQMLFLSLGEQEVRIAIWGRVLLCSWFYVVNFPFW